MKMQSLLDIFKCEVYTENAKQTLQKEGLHEKPYPGTAEAP